MSTQRQVQDDLQEGSTTFNNFDSYFGLAQTIDSSAPPALFQFGGRNPAHQLAHPQCALVDVPDLILTFIGK
jgi:hypothetical protein